MNRSILGMLAVGVVASTFLVRASLASKENSPGAGQTRTYYVAADEAEWESDGTCSILATSSTSIRRTGTEMS